jgi:DNA mismatch repair protein MutS
VRSVLWPLWKNSSAQVEEVRRSGGEQPPTNECDSGERVVSTFGSVLFPDGRPVEDAGQPDFFRDLNFVAVVRTVAGRQDEHQLAPLFALPLKTADEVEYRHEVFRDLGREDLRTAVATFAEEAAWVGRYLHLAAKQNYRLERERWFVDGAARYVAAISTLQSSLEQHEPVSRALRGLNDHLAVYTHSAAFESLARETDEVLTALGRVRYAVRIKGHRVTVGGEDEGVDYSAEIERTFERFRQNATEDHNAAPPDTGSMSLVEAQIAEIVARHHPREFAALDTFCKHHRDFIDATVWRFGREIHFYLSWLALVEQLNGEGLPFCLPELAVDKDASAEGAYDLALALVLLRDKGKIVQNGFELHDGERIIVVSGPNQGGKTTFARMFGQLHQLARLGLLVPAEQARLVLADEIYTHFEREEDLATLCGKLDDELLRIKEILEQATGDSVVVLNEIFAATTLADAVVLGSEVINRLAELECLAVCVTFIDELASLEATVSMVSTVEPNDPSKRTFRIVRRRADGRAYAWALAEKYGLSYERLRSRVGR